jgi:hypothetical protein
LPRDAGVVGDTPLGRDAELLEHRLRAVVLEVPAGAEAAREVVTVAGGVPTEASLLAARCALGETGPAPIRGGRRTVELGPVGALGFLFDARRAIGAAAPLADLVRSADSIETARAAMAADGIRTELDYERERLAGRSA